jgi:hypothetical protein
MTVEAEGGAAAIERSVDWNLTEGGGVLVLEVAGRNILRARVVAEGSSGIATQLAELRDDPEDFTLVELTLPPDRYRTVRIELEPTPGLSHIQRTTGLSVIRAGRLDLRGYSVYPLVSESPSDRR